MVLEGILARKLSLPLNPTLFYRYFVRFLPLKQFIPIILPNYLRVLLSFLDICDLFTRNVPVKRRENIPILFLLVIIHELVLPLLLFLGN